MRLASFLGGERLKFPARYFFLKVAGVFPFEFSWVGAVKAAVEKGIVTGYPDNTFRPKATLKRVEAAAVIVSTLELLKKP